MTNDLTTLEGSLDEMKDQLISELEDKGVTATFDSTTGLLGLVSKIGDIQTGGSGEVANVATGTFTTGSSGASTGTVSLDYSGNGYPIAALVFVAAGLSGTSTSWYTDPARYDVGLVLITKAITSTTPTYATSGNQNYGAITYLYKSSASNATSYSRSGSQTANTYTNSSSNAGPSSAMIRFKGNAKTLSYYVGNRTNTTYGLARSTTFHYIVLYTE